MENFNTQQGCFGTNIFLTGFMGSGKTHWGKIWSEKNKCDFIDLDELVENNESKSISEIFESFGEDHFRKLEAQALRTCASLNNTIIACGGGTPCFHNNMEWMNENGSTVYISCTPIEILKRVSMEQDKRPLFKNLNQVELLFFIEQKLKEREPFYTQAEHIISWQMLTPETLSNII